MGKRGEWTEVMRDLREAGFEIYMLKSGHYGVFRPNGVRVYTLSYSPSDRRAYQNMIAWFRRNLGIDLGKRKGGRTGGDIPGQRTADADQRS